FGEVKASRPDASDNELCINIKKSFPKRYPTENPGTLRRNLQYARDPSRNYKLAQIRDQFAIMIRDRATDGSSSTDPGALSEMALTRAREYLESAWEHSAAKK